MAGRINLKALSKERISDLFNQHGLPRYRVGQLLRWMYEKYARDIQDITEFSKDLRNALEKIAYIGDLAILERIRSEDGTEKFLFGLEDGETIESVLIPEKDRLTLCISSQVGCAMGCRFCMTGKLGFTRNLHAHEIVDQIIAVNRTLDQERRITNIVLMGMGEPLANIENVSAALWTVVELIGISKRKITLSTAGLAPKILLLARSAPGINLAVSLNSSRDETRDKLMPVNRKYPIKTLLAACKNFPLDAHRRITIEYVLIDKVNDSAEDAEQLVKILRGIRCKVNLIPLNPYKGSDLDRPPAERIEKFQGILLRNNLIALIRESRGRDIRAACGQLKGAREAQSGTGCATRSGRGSAGQAKRPKGWGMPGEQSNEEFC